MLINLVGIEGITELTQELPQIRSISNTNVDGNLHDVAIGVGQMLE